MFEQAIEAAAVAAEKKVAALERSLPRYLLMAALAGAYVGLGIALIFAIGAPLSAANSPFTKVVMGASFGVALSLVVVAGAELFTGNVMLLPLGEIHEPDAAEARLAVDLICASTVQCAVFLTGVGVQTIVESARRLRQEERLFEGLAGKRIAARGPKTLNALRRIGARVDLVAPDPFTSTALLERIAREWDLHAQTPSRGAGGGVRIGV